MADKQTFEKPKVKLLHTQDSQHIQLSYIIHYYFNQETPDSLIALLRKYESYGAELLDYTHFIIVDDCSPLIFDIPNFNLNITWLRISDNIPWNQGGSRNLGVTYAKSDKILISDLDIEFPEHTLKYMLNAANPGKKFYKIKRMDTEQGRVRKGHPNTFFMSRARFMRFYGYDEEFCGGYGAEDYRFVKFQKYHGSWQRYLPDKYYYYKRMQINRDESYHSLKRDFSRNTPIDKRKRAELIEWGAEAGHSRIFLNFNWKTVFTHYRPKPQRPPKKLWKKLWLTRLLFTKW